MEQTVLTGSLLVAAPIAVAAGVVSFLSPCVLPLVPAYLSYMTGLTGAELAGEAEVARRGPGGTVIIERAPSRPRLHGRVLAGTWLFVAGFTVVFVSFGALFGGLGGLLLEHRDLITRVMGGVVILMGLAFLGLIPGLQRQRRVNPGRSVRWGLAGAPLLGATFALGWVPCIGPTLAAVLTLSATEASALRGALLSLAYCLGLGLPFVVVGLLFRSSAGALGFARRHHRAITRAGGAMLVALGLLLLTGTWDRLVAGIQGWVGGFTPVI